MATRNELIADLLMGAAYADQHLDGREMDAARRTLAKAMRSKKVPPGLVQRLERFDPKRFDLEATVAKLRLASDQHKRHLLELIAEVHASDEVLDLDEDAYLRAVARALGLPPEAYQDLAIENLSIEAITLAGDALMDGDGRSGRPPPLPT